MGARRDQYTGGNECRRGARAVYEISSSKA